MSANVAGHGSEYNAYRSFWRLIWSHTHICRCKLLQIFWVLWSPLGVVDCCVEGAEKSQNKYEGCCKYHSRLYLTRQMSLLPVSHLHLFSLSGLSAVQKEVSPPLSTSFSVLSTFKTRDYDCPYRDQSWEFKLIMYFEITRFEFISLGFRVQLLCASKLLSATMKGRCFFNFFFFFKESWGSPLMSQ